MRSPNFRNNTIDVIAGSYLHIPIVGYSVNAFRLLDTRERVEKTQKILEDKDPAQLATLTREDILGDLFYTGGLGYFAQLHTMNRMAGQYGNGVGKVNIGYGSYGYEPKLKQAGILATPVGILPGSIATNMRVHQTHWSKDNTVNDNNIGFTMGMNSSILESAISEQLFCNEQVNPNNEPCYGISTVSGLQRAAQQGQKIYQISQKNRAQLSNIAMSDPEKAVDGTGRNAIYVYMTYNGQTGHQSWKISGGLNGGYMGLALGAAAGLSLLGVLSGGSSIVATILAAEAMVIALLSSVILLSILSIFDSINPNPDAPGQQTLKCFTKGFLSGFEAVLLGSIVMTETKRTRIMLAIAEVITYSLGIALDDDLPSLQECGVI